MPAVNSRQGLINYCMRQLGAPMVKVNIAPSQIEDRIDDALQMFQDYHYDATERYYLKHQVTADDQTNQYIDINDPLIISVNRILPFSQNTINFFDIRYQVRLNDFYNFNNVSMVHYQITRQHLALLDFLFNMEPSYQFNRHGNRITIEMDWQNDIQVSQFMIFECIRAIDPQTVTDIYNDRWLKAYATALLKKQWAQNMSKYKEIELPGGVKLNADGLKEEAEKEIEKLEEQVKNEFSLPVDFMMG